MSSLELSRNPENSLSIATNLALESAVSIFSNISAQFLFNTSTILTETLSKNNQDKSRHWY